VELLASLRGVFDVRTAARSIALTIEAAASDFRRRVPVALMRRVHELVIDLPPPPLVAPCVASPLPSLVDPGAHGSRGDATQPAVEVRRGRKRDRATDTPQRSNSSSSGEAGSGADDFSSDDDDGYDLQRHIPKTPNIVWERDAPLLAYGEALEEPALASTGASAGEQRKLHLSLPLLPHSPSTSASALKFMEFFRAVVVDPIAVWGPQSSWVTVDELVELLRSADFSIPRLAALLRWT